MKLDAAEHAGIGKNQRVRGGVENEVIVFARRVRGGEDAELAGHAKVDTEPGVDGRSGLGGGALETEKNLFRGGGGGVVNSLSERGAKGGGGRGAEKFFGVVGVDAENRRGAQRGLVPAFAEKFGFSEFGHRELRDERVTTNEMNFGENFRCKIN